MKKTFNINLSGIVFTIDEDAYALLSDYLDTLQHAFSKEEDGEEILHDIEARAAELLLEMLGEERTVVTLADVENVIARIGRPEEMIGEVSDSEETIIIDEEVAGNDGPPLPPPYSGPNQAPRRKLFRDPQNAMIGGVCAGFAAYLHVDVTWVRLFTIAISLLSVSTAALIYVVLWIVLPEAKTPYQRMEMNGEAPTIANIGRSVTNVFRGERGENQEMKNDMEQPRTGFKRFLDSLVQICGAIAKIILVAILIVSFPVLFALAIALIACIFALILFSTSLGAALWENVPLNIFGNNVEEPILALFCAIGFIIAIGIPLFSLIWICIFKNHPMSSGWKKALVSTWVVGFILAGVTTGLLAVRSSTDDWRDNLRNIPNIQKIEDVNVDIDIDDIDDLKELMDETDSVITITGRNGYEISKMVTDSVTKLIITHNGDTVVQVNDGEKKRIDLDSGKGKASERSRINSRK